MSKEHVLDIKGIRQKYTKRVNSFIVCSALCQGPPNCDPMDSEKQLRVYMSDSTMARHMWRVDKAPGHTRRNQNACLKVLRLSMGKMFACTYGVLCELVINIKSVMSWSTIHACRVLLEKKFSKVFCQVWSLLFSIIASRCVAAGYTTKDFCLIQNTDVFGRLKWSWPEQSGQDRLNTHSYVLHTLRHALNGAFTASSVWLIRPCCYQMQFQRYSR